MLNNPNASQANYGSSVYTWYVVAVLMFMGFYSYLDRQIIVLLIDPIRRDLDITNVQISLLTGFAFGLLYAICGLPLAWMADCLSRRWLIFGGVSFWGLATSACGLSNSFFHLFMARVGVGAGEATLYPASFSMAGDIFPPKRLAFASSVLAAGSLIGLGMSFVLGGAVASFVAATPQIYLPILGEVRTWQAAFIVLGMFGPIIALFLLTVREPRRTTSRTVIGTSSGSLLSFLRFRARYFGFYTAGYGLLGIGLYAGLTWAPAYMMRVFGWSGVDVGGSIGVVTISGMGIAFIGGGILMDRLYVRGMKDAPVRLFAYSSFLLLPVVIIGIAADNPWVFLASLFIWNILTSHFGPAGFTAMQIITPNEFRARLTAVFLFVSNLVGYGVGPLLVAMLTDYLFHDDKMVGGSLLIVFLVVYPLAGICLFCASKALRDIHNEMVDKPLN